MCDCINTYIAGLLWIQKIMLDIWWVKLLFIIELCETTDLSAEEITNAACSGMEGMEKQSCNKFWAQSDAKYRALSRVHNITFLIP